MTIDSNPNPLTTEEQEVFQFLKDKIGTRLDSDAQSNPIWGQVPYYTVVNHDLARQYSWAIGDLNPLFRDPHYAQSTLGKVVAPPSVVFPLGPGGLSGSLFANLGAIAGAHETWGGTNCIWHDWFADGDIISAESTLKDVRLKVSDKFGPMIQLIAQTDYYNQNRKLIASVESWVFRKREANYADKSMGLDIPHWSEEELLNVQQSKLAEHRTGSNPVSLNLGDTKQIIKGPYTLNMGLSFLCAWQGYLFGRGDTPWEMAPHWLRDESGLLMEPHVSGHYDKRKTDLMGLPGVYDFGPQRASWAIQLITDWMGDQAFLKSLNFRVLSFNLVGDLQTFTGEVVNIAESTDNYVSVDLAITATNQRGQVTAAGTASVSIPTGSERRNR